MRRISTSVITALFILLFVSICSAQQSSTSAVPSTQSDAQGDTLGYGTKGYISMWLNQVYLGNSVLFQNGNKSVGVGTTTPMATLDVNGSINAATTYGIGGIGVLSIGSAADQNLFLGSGAGASDVTGFGKYNVFSGHQAGYKNTDGQGNTFSGYEAGVNNTTGMLNSFYGYFAGYNNTGGYNNVYIANVGSPSGESNTIRLGGDTGLGPQTATYITGIYGAFTGGGVAVYINGLGQLGTQTSSVRFKEQVRDMGDSTNALMKLRPVTFLYKPEYDKDERTLQYGLIAEEVAKVYPELVAYDNDGRPYTVRYQYITTMLLNEVQKQYHRAEAEAKVITAQEQKIDELEQRLSRLESLIPQIVAQK